MGKNSAIEWTDHTLNFWQGCRPVSEGCVNCYMYRDKHRYGQDPTKVIRSKDATFRSARKWKTPAKVFVCSWSDFFIEEADEWREEAWSEIRQAPHLTWIILTKRPQNISDRLPGDWGNGWPNVWLGVSAENQPAADERIPILLQTPAVVRFVSVEPMLGPLDLGKWIGPRMCYCGWRGYEWEEEDDPESDDETLCPNCGASSLYELGDVDTCCGYSDDYERHPIHWIIAGGESGHGARPCHPDWVRSLRDQAKAAGVSFFFKQWGEYCPCIPNNSFEPMVTNLDCVGVRGHKAVTMDDGLVMERVGKKKAGRLLDGREWNEMPEGSEEV